MLLGAALIDVFDCSLCKRKCEFNLAIMHRSYNLKNKPENL